MRADCFPHPTVLARFEVTTALKASSNSRFSSSRNSKITSARQSPQLCKQQGGPQGGSRHGNRRKGRESPAKVAPRTTCFQRSSCPSTCSRRPSPTHPSKSSSIPCHGRAGSGGVYRWTSRRAGSLSANPGSWWSGEPGSNLASCNAMKNPHPRPLSQNGRGEPCALTPASPSPPAPLPEGEGSFRKNLSAPS